MSTLQWLLGAYDTKGRTPLSDAPLRTGLSALPEPDVALSPMLATLVSVLRQAPYLLLSLHSTNTQTGRQGWGKKRGETTGNQADWKQEGVQSPGSPGCSRAAWEREEVRLRESQPAPPSSSARSQKLSLAERRNWAASRSPRVRESQRAVRLLIHTQEGWTDRHTHKNPESGRVLSAWLPLPPPALPLVPGHPACPQGSAQGPSTATPTPHTESVCLGPTSFLRPPRGPALTSSQHLAHGFGCV